MKAGLVLSGGIAKGAYQIGVLKVFSKYLPRDFFSHISASSIGVLNAYAYLTDQLNEAEEIWKNQNYSGMLGFIRSFMKDSYLDTLMSRIKAKPLNHPCDFYISALSISSMRLSYINVKDIAVEEMWNYLKAGVSLPPFRAPVKIKNDQYVDGAMVDNIPVYPLISHAPNLTIVQYFDNKDISFENEEFNDHVIQLTFTEEKIIHDSFAFDNASVCKMIDLGEKKALKMIKEYQLDNYETLDDIYKHINRTQTKHTVRVTGDMLVNNLNIVAKKLIKYSVVKNEELQGGNAPLVIENEHK